LKIPTDFIRNGKNIFLNEQKTILSGAAVISVTLLASAILGLIKMRLYAGVLGAGAEFDTFVAAFKIPDFVFQLVVVGSLNAAFIPIFSEFIGRKEAKAAWKFASNILSLSFFIFVGLCVLLFIFARPLSILVAAGFPPSQIDKLVTLMRIMLLSPILLGVSSFISGCLQSFKRFLVPFLSPIFYNLGAIFGVLILYQPLGLPGLAWGVVLGAFFHLLVQIPLLRYLGFEYSPTFSFKDALFVKMAELALPRTIGLAAEQIKGIFLVNLASLLPPGNISLLRFGESIQTVPVSVVGVAIAQAALPTLSHEAQNQKLFRQTLSTSFLQMCYLILPVSAVLIVLKIPVVRLTLGIGKFDWAATVDTSWVLALFAISLLAQSANALFVRAFYALQDTKTPVAISVFSVLISLLTALTLLPFLQVRALPLGVSLGAFLEFFLLFFFLDKKIIFEKKKIISATAKIFFATIVSAICIYVPVKVLDQVFIDTTKVVNLIILVWLVLSFGGTVYLFLTWFLGCDEIRLFVSLLFKLKNWRQALLSARRITPSSQPSFLDDVA